MSKIGDALKVLKELRQEYWDNGTGLRTDYYITFDDIVKLDDAISIIEKHCSNLDIDKSKPKLAIEWHDSCRGYYLCPTCDKRPILSWKENTKSGESLFCPLCNTRYIVP